MLRRAPKNELLTTMIEPREAENVFISSNYLEAILVVTEIK